MESDRRQLQSVRWTLVLGAFIAAYLAGALGALALQRLGWWDGGAGWERDMLRWAHSTASPWLDPFFLVMPLFGTNYTLVPLVAFAALWLWRPPGWIGTVLMGILGAVIGAGSVHAVATFAAGTSAPGWLLAGLAALGAGVAVLLDRRHTSRTARPVPAAHLVTAQLGSWLLNPALKFSLPRARPELFERRGQHDFPAYPSGHSIAVTAVLFTAAYLVHRTGHGTWAYWVVGAFFVLNSYSRIYLSVHWPTDVIGGTLVGLVWLLALIAIFRPAHTPRTPTP